MSAIASVQRVWRRLRQRVRRDRVRRVVDAEAAGGPLERELVEQEVDHLKEDVFAAGGDGVVAPTLPETTPAGLYEQFERDESAPRDESP